MYDEMTATIMSFVLHLIVFYEIFWIIYKNISHPSHLQYPELRLTDDIAILKLDYKSIVHVDAFLEVF
jgi:hypothetical protein